MTTAALLTIAQVAQRLGVATHTVRRIDPADLPYFLVSTRGDRRYAPEDVDLYLRQHRRGGSDEPDIA